MFLLLFFNLNIVLASSYGIKYLPIENLDLKVEEIKKYHFYKEERISSYFRVNEEPNGFIKTDDSYLTDYSSWSKEYPALKENREIKERQIYKYAKERSLKHIRIIVDDSSESVLEFAFYINGNNVLSNATCNTCSSGYYYNLTDRSYDIPVKVGTIDINLSSYYSVDSLSFKVKFNKENINYKIILYDSNQYGNIIKEKSFVSSLELETLYARDFDVKNLYEYELETPIILDMPVIDSYKEYQYRDKYFKYEFVNKIYYPTYEENVDGYIKDENDFILEKKYFYLEKAFIKDKIVINNENYDLADYIKTSLPFEIASNIDISKNGNYKIKYIFDSKAIEKTVSVKTNNEYIKSLEDELKKKKDEIINITNDKNDLIERYESNLKSKDEIISKKQVENHIVKQSPIPIILITIGVMLIIFIIFKSIKNTVELKK